MWKLMAVLVFCVAACSAEPKPGSPPVYEDRDVQAAVQQARDTLNVYWAAAESGDPAFTGFALTVITPSDAYEKDYVLVTDIARDGPGWISTVPDYHEAAGDGFVPGDKISFVAADIVDWRYRESGKFRGAYLSRAMMKFVPEGTDVSNIRALYHDNPVPEAMAEDRN